MWVWGPLIHQPAPNAAFPLLLPFPLTLTPNSTLLLS